ncbi:MAG: DUF402 domain-containing protein [Aigarchaeota archaeon]|nr:DUF402 domain-containing protein [Aigarchaeota archaeon]MCX8192381.1 DUF402 domain-containing protein [Nitrososphaeria archaeon]MDW7986950.1 DUF402 domain-containing protein [Nitrososphaerota archaeon]
MKVSVRGIYSTALIKLLMDKGFKIVNPTRSQVERFNIQEPTLEPDAVIVDSIDRHFIEVKGDLEVVKTLVDVMKSFFEDLIVLWKRDEVLSHVRIGFPVDAKRKLDELRSSVAYTVPWHHYCRAGGEALSSMVSFAEDLVERGLVNPREMDKMFEEQVRQFTPKLGSKVKIVHVKLHGERIVLGPGKVVWRSNDSIKILRRIMSSGVYDGLGIPKQIGDYAITEARRLETWTKTSYYNFSGVLKGVYYNICTPVAFYPDQIHYFDLEIDVVALPDHEPRVIDEEFLKQAFEKGIISYELFEKSLRIVREIICKKV